MNRTFLEKPKGKLFLKNIFLWIIITLMTSGSGCPPEEPEPVITWERTFGGGSSEVARSIQQTNDGGYIVAGSTMSFAVGTFDYYIIKLDKWGNKVWEKNYGSEYFELANSVQQTNDGGYIIAGLQQVPSTGNDCLILKLDSNGNKSWEKIYGGENWDVANSVQQTIDGGYIVAGYTEPHNLGKEDLYIIKLDQHGDVMWEQTFGGPDYDVAHSIQQTVDGGYIVAGTTESIDPGNRDMYVIKCDGTGNEVWAKTFGGGEVEAAYSVQQTIDGGYIIAGITESIDPGNMDWYVIKLDGNGNMLWEKTFGSTGTDFAWSIQQTVDGGYIVAGSFKPVDSMDLKIVRLDGNGNKLWEKIYGDSDDDGAYSIRQTSDGGYIVAGYTHVPGSSSANDDMYILKLDENGDL